MDATRAKAPEPVGRLSTIQIDCRDLDTMTEFWSEVLGVEVDDDSPPNYRCLRSPEAVPTLCFQRVPEPKTVKNRLHLDIVVPDVEAASARIESLGGARHPDGDFRENGWTWRVMTDPEGNEFCLVPSS
jgi:predicted enzyme related to lactoylglutathione lyase